MQEQMKQQFEQFQNGFKSMFENGPKMMEPALRSSEVAMESLSKLAGDQFEFGRSCLDIGRRQLESVAQGNDVTALFPNQDASSEYYTATQRYSEALRENAERTQERFAAIAREATVKVASSPTATCDTGAVNGPEGAEAEAAAAEPKGDATRGDLDLLDVHEFAALIGAGSAQTVRNRLHRGRLIGWKDARGAFVLPAGQINQHKKPLHGLAEVITVFGNGHAAWNWLTTATLENGRTPLEELQAGGFRVVEHAAHATAPETETSA